MNTPVRHSKSLWNPLATTAWLTRRLQWIVTASFVLVMVAYAGSGIQFIAPEEVAIIVRAGRFVGGGDSPTIYPSGPLWSFPAPIDRVVRVPIRREATLTLSFLDLADSSASSVEAPHAAWICTGDHALVALSAQVKYTIASPREFLCGSVAPEVLLERIVRHAITTTLNQWSTDEALRLHTERADLANGIESGDVEARVDESRRMLPLVDLLRAVCNRELQRLQLGLQITRLEINQISPPQEVVEAFEVLQTARIEQMTLLDRSRGESSELVTEAEALAAQTVAESRGRDATRRAEVTAQITAFQAALGVPSTGPSAATRERLRQEAWRHILDNVGNTLFFSPGRGSSRLRVELPWSGV